MVIDELFAKKGTQLLPIDSYDNQVIDEIEYEGQKFHFAKQKDLTGTTEIVADNAVNEPIRELSIDGNTEQKQLTGKNLFDLSLGAYSGGRHIISQTETSITVKGAGSYVSANMKIPNWQNLLGKTVTIMAKYSKTGTNIRPAIRLIGFNDGSANTGSSDIYINELATNQSGTLKVKGTITKLPNTETYPNAQLCLALYVNSSGTSDANEETTYSDIMIVEGDYTNVDLPYEEYCGGIPSPNPTYPQEIQNADNMSVELSADFETKTIQIPSEVTLADGTVVPLRFGKVDTYVDKLLVDKINNKVLYQEYTQSIKLNSNSNFGGYKWKLNEYALNNKNENIFEIHNFPSQYYIAGKGYCNYFTKEIWYKARDNVFFVTDFLLLFRTNGIETLAEWKARIDELEANGTPLEVLVAKPTPIEYDLTDTDLGRELLAIEMQKGTDIFTITSDNVPVSKTDLSYWRQIIPNE